MMLLESCNILATEGGGVIIVLVTAGSFKKLLVTTYVKAYAISNSLSTKPKRGRSSIRILSSQSPEHRRLKQWRTESGGNFGAYKK